MFSRYCEITDGALPRHGLMLSQLLFEIKGDDFMNHVERVKRGACWGLWLRGIIAVADAWNQCFK